jgi:hypothetical protein
VVTVWDRVTRPLPRLSLLAPFDRKGSIRTRFKSSDPFSNVSATNSLSAAVAIIVALGVDRHFSHREWRQYTAGLRRRQRLHYRVARQFGVMLPLVLFLYAVALATR